MRAADRHAAEPHRDGARFRAADDDEPPVHPRAGGRESRGSRDRAGSRTSGGFVSFLYSHSLGIALAALFVASFALHLWGSYRAAVDDALLHGTPEPSLAAHLLGAQFWFESFQNWQSEFLATAALVVLSIVLRFRGSPESKHVEASHAETGR